MILIQSLKANYLAQNYYLYQQKVCQDFLKLKLKNLVIF